MLKKHKNIILLVVLLILLVLETKNYYKLYEKDIHKEKFINIAYQFIGYPYKSNPIDCKKIEYIPTLSEITNFDCVTLIETILSLYIQNQMTSYIFQKNLQKMRYKDAINNCKNRNHFFIFDWIKNNPLFSFKNITNSLIAIEKIKTKVAVIDKSKWFKQTYNLDLKTKTLYLQFDYAQFSDILNNKEQLSKSLPPISLIVIVNKKRNIDISHVGFLIKERKKVIFLHASSKKGKVIKEDLIDYLSNIISNSNLIGISVFKIETKK